MKRFDIKEWLLAFWEKCKDLPWARIGLITLCSVLALILIALIFVTAYTEHLLGQITDLTDPPTESNTSPSTGHTAPSVPPDVTIHVDPTLPSEPHAVIAHEDIVNIMLVGQDRRPGTTGRTLSDVMILCTLNKKDNTITLTSFMRDTYVSIPDYGFAKMNAAYPSGGMKRLSKTLLKNFGVQVDAFVEVDFQAFKKVVDILGGVNINLTAAEAKYMNTVPLDGVDYEYWNLKPGMNRLTGNQALYYSRIRKIDSDFNRTQRQRNVLNAIIKGCKNMSLSQLLSLMNQVLPYIGTDMTNGEIISYATELFPLLANGTVISQRIPIDGSFQDSGSNIYIDLDLNRQFLIDTLLPD